MIRRLLSVLILAVLISWIVLSYAPVTLPQVAFAGGWATPLFQLLAVGGLLSVAAIQVLLLRATGRMLRPAGGHAEVVAEFRLKSGAELFWTALPLLMTVLLGVAAYPLWLHLP